MHRFEAGQFLARIGHRLGGIDHGLALLLHFERALGIGVAVLCRERVDRLLRVVLAGEPEPYRVVTVFFDRRLRRKGL